MLDNIVNFYQNQDKFEEAIFLIEPIFEKANLNDNRCLEKYKKYEEVIFKIKAYNSQNNQEVGRNEDLGDI